MARGKEHGEEARAAVMAALLAGQGVHEIAAKYRLPERTIRRWREAQLAEVGHKKAQRIDDLIYDYLAANLSSLRSQAEAVAEKRYVQKQTASDLAILHGVMADKAIRILEASEIGASTSETDDTDA